jgi:hypothetical protein
LLACAGGPCGEGRREKECQRVGVPVASSHHLGLRLLGRRRLKVDVEADDGPEVESEMVHGIPWIV